MSPVVHWGQAYSALSETTVGGRVTQLELQGVRKCYTDTVALDSVDLSVPTGEFLTILGPSGSGKTTILRIVAGFTEPTEGALLLDGRNIARLAPAQRGIGMVFQDYALFPHMDVQENIAYGLKMRKWDKRARRSRVEEMLELVGLGGMGKRLPRQLSGGQQQRVALARALAFKPSILLMDEPLGALDRELRGRMAIELRRVHEEVKATTVFVTHDREEAMTLSDRIAVMRDGRVEATGPPRDLYQLPTTRFVAGFFATRNVLPTKVLHLQGDRATVALLDGEWNAAAVGVTGEGEAALTLPETAIGLASREAGGPTGEAVVSDAWYVGDRLRASCLLNQVGQVWALFPIRDGNLVYKGATVKLAIDMGEAVVVP